MISSLSLIFLVLCSLGAATVLAAPQPCNTDMLQDAYFALTYDDMTRYSTVLKNGRIPLNEDRFGADRRADALNHFKSLGFDFTDTAASTPQNVTLQGRTFEGLELFAVVTPNFRLFNEPNNIRVYADEMRVVVTDPYGLTLPADPANGIPEAHYEQGSFLSYGYYSFENEDTKTKPFQDIRYFAQVFGAIFEDKSGNYEYIIESPEWGSGLAMGHYTMPMHDKMTGLYRIGHRETLQFPGH